MERLRHAIITQGTYMICPQYDEEGKLGSMVLQNGDFIYADISPTDLVDYSIRCYGSSLRGAVDGTRTIFGEDIFMPPVIVSEKLGLYWFPSKSSSSPKCIWFSAGDIDRFKTIDKEHIQVFFIDGSDMTVNCSAYSFESKYLRACRLKGRMEARTNVMVVHEKQSSYSIRMDSSKRNFEVEKQ
ncbi:competence protein ComK [Sporosarcina cascadiensis]|uniref:competence protein ComK n=1 Tax=Sporosarcina cascadiensis TaxID=2660747 RepID=UPI00129BA8D8|nr:competence protein ComK [Sporosarcina cascadiensis]